MRASFCSALACSECAVRGGGFPELGRIAVEFSPSEVLGSSGVYCLELGFPGKRILRGYFQQNMISRRSFLPPFLLPFL